MRPVIWKRYGLGRCPPHAAHAFVDGRQVCRTLHGKTVVPLPLAGAEPRTVELAANGLPYGRICALCLKQYRVAESQAS